MLFIGGRRSVIGAVVGALVIQYLQGASNWVSVNILVVEGLLLTVVLLVDPEGLAGIAHTATAWLRARYGDRAARRRERPRRAAAAAAAPRAGRTGALKLEPVMAGQRFSANEPAGETRAATAA